jgi:hypothetical protein
MLIIGPWLYEIVLSAVKQCDLNCIRLEKKGKLQGEFIVITLPCFVISINFVNKIGEYLCVSEWGIIHSLTWKVCVSAILCWCKRFDTVTFFALDTSGTSDTYKSKKWILFLFIYSPYQRIFLMKVAVFNKFSFIVMYWFYLWQDAIRSLLCLNLGFMQRKYCHWAHIPRLGCIVV